MTGGGDSVLNIWKVICHIFQHISTCYGFKTIGKLSSILVNFTKPYHCKMKMHSQEHCKIDDIWFKVNMIWLKNVSISNRVFPFFFNFA